MAENGSEAHPIYVRIKAIDETGEAWKSIKQQADAVNNTNVSGTTKEVEKMSTAMKGLVGLDVASRLGKGFETVSKTAEEVSIKFGTARNLMTDSLMKFSSDKFSPTDRKKAVDNYRKSVEELGISYVYSTAEQKDFLLGMDALASKMMKNSMGSVMSAQRMFYDEAVLSANKYIEKSAKVVIANDGIATSMSNLYAGKFLRRMAWARNANNPLDDYQVAQVANMLAPTGQLAKAVSKNVKAAFATASMGWNANNLFANFYNKTSGMHTAENVFALKNYFGKGTGGILGVAMADFKNLGNVFTSVGKSAKPTTTALATMYAQLKAGKTTALVPTTTALATLKQGLTTALVPVKTLATGVTSNFHNMAIALKTNRMAWDSFFANMKTQLSPLKQKIDAVKGAFLSFIYAYPSIVAGVTAIASAFTTLAIGMKTAYEQAEKIKEISDTAAQIGSTYESVEKYTNMADIYGYSASDYETAFKRMRVNIAKGKDSDAYDAIKALGIDDVASMSNTEAFDTIVGKLQKVEDQTTKTRLAYKIFGRGATNITPLLNAQAEDVERLANAYKILGSSVSEEAQQNSTYLENDLKMLSEAFEGLKNSMTGFIPALDWLVSKLTLLVGYTTVILDLIFGVKLSLDDAEDSINSTKDSIDETTESLEELYEEGARAFDELNDISTSSETDVDIDEDEISQQIGLASSLSDTMNDTLDKIEEFRLKVADFQEQYGTLMPWILMLGGALAGIICLLLGHPLVAIGCFALAGTGAAALVSQLGNFETIEQDGNTWNTYFDELATQLDNSVGKVLTPALVGVLSCLAGILMLIFGGLAIKCAGIALLVAGGWMLTECSQAEDLNEDGKISWTEFMTTVKEGVLAGNPALQQCASIFSAIAGILLILFGTLKLKIVGFGLIALAVVLNANVGSNITNLSEDTGTFKSLFINAFAGMSELVGPEMGQKLMIIGVITVIAGLLILILAPGITLKKLGLFAILAGLGMTTIGGLSQTDFEQMTEDGFNFKTLIINAFSGFSEVASSTFAQISSIVMVIGGLLLLCFGPTVGLKASGIVLMLLGLGIGALGSISKSTWQQLADGNTEGFKNSIAVDLGLTWRYKENDDGTTTEIRKATGINSDWMKYSNITFAHGGFIQQSYSTGNITVGEDGKEAIIPLEKNTEWADLMADRLSEKMGTGGNTTIVLEIDGKQFAKTTVKSINDLTKSTGRLALNLS